LWAWQRALPEPTVTKNNTFIIWYLSLKNSFFLHFFQKKLPQLLEEFPEWYLGMRYKQDAAGRARASL
jgi:hypothetical protein